MGLETTIKKQIVSLKDIQEAQQNLQGICDVSALQINHRLSEKYSCNVYLKREDMQLIRSFKIRGAYNKIASLTQIEKKRGIICASAGNHAQGVAYSCAALGIYGTIYMPNPTPDQKIKKVKSFGGQWVKVILFGDTFDDANEKALIAAKEEESTFIHPFDDEKVISGQGTIGLEIMNQLDGDLDYIFIAVGGGGLISGVGTCLNNLSPKTKIIAVESLGAAAMSESLKAGKRVSLQRLDTFADGIAVKQVGEKNFQIAKDFISDCILVPEGKICTTILEMYNEDAIVVEPAGAISIAALDYFKNEIHNKNICVIVCGGNNDITRTQEIRERSLLYEGKKHYFIIRFPQRAGALKEFLHVLGPDDDITHFEYTKKHNRENGPALVGIELKHAEDYQNLISKMESSEIEFESVNQKPLLFEMLI